MPARCRLVCKFLDPATAFAVAVSRHDSGIAAPPGKGSAHTARSMDEEIRLAA